MNATKAWEVASHFAQSRQYYQSAAGGATKMVRGVLSFGSPQLCSTIFMLRCQNPERCLSHLLLNVEDTGDHALSGYPQRTSNLDNLGNFRRAPFGPP